MICLADFSWSCGRRGGKVQPMHQNTHRFSDYLMHLARAKSLDKEKSGFLDEETLGYAIHVSSMNLSSAYYCA